MDKISPLMGLIPHRSPQRAHFSSLATLIFLLSAGFMQAQFPSVNWTYQLPAPAFGSSAAADVDEDGFLELIFTTYTNDGMAHCLNAQDGTVLWTYDIGGCGDVAPIIYDLDGDDTLDVFINGSCNPTCFCINARTGRLKWSQPSGGGDSPPTVADIDQDGKPEVLFGNFSGEVRILNGEDGSNNRTIPVFNDPIQTEPTIGDLDNDGDLDFIVCNHINNSGFYTYAFDYATNDTLWTNFKAVLASVTYYAYHGGILADVDADGKLEYVIGANDGTIRALNGEDGSELWQVTGRTNVISALSVANFDQDPALEIVYNNNDYVNFNDHIGLLDGATGNLDWSYPITFSAFRGVAISDINGNGKLDCVSGHFMGEVIAVEPFTGLVWNYDVDPYFLTTPSLPYYEVDHGPIIADFDHNGKMDVFVVAGYGTYTPDSQNIGYAFSFEAGNGTCPEWLMFRQDVHRSGYLSAAEIAASCNPVAVEAPAASLNASIYPNPGQGTFTLSWMQEITGEAQLELFDLRGIKVYQEAIASRQGGTQTHPFSPNLSPGVYLWRMTSQNGFSHTGKLLIAE